MIWHQFDNGNTIGQEGRMEGIIIFDEEHEFGARITIEKESKIYPKLFCTNAEIYGGYYSFSCHYNSTSEQAKKDAEFIKTEFEKALSIIAKTPPEGKRNYDNLSKIFIELYIWGEKFEESFGNLQSPKPM